MVPLVITDDIRARAKEVQRYAFEHRESTTALRDRISTGTPPPAADPGKTMYIPMGYTIVYNIEQASPAIGWCQHVSVAVSKPMMDPDPRKVAQILELFGIVQKKPTPQGIISEAINISEEKLPGALKLKCMLFPFSFELYRQSLLDAKAAPAA